MSEQPQIRKVVRIECIGKSTHATKVLLDDGSELQGITRIELEAQPNDVWRAQIYLLPDSVALEAEADLVAAVLPAPVEGEQDVTALDDTDRRFQPVRKAE